MVDRLPQRSRQITDFPLSGRRVPEFDIDRIREVIEGPHRIIYRIKPDRFDVLAVVHAVRNVFRAGSNVTRTSGTTRY
jgi:plasmid stabilization system protein ParE